MVEGDIPVAGSNGIIGFHNEYTPISPCITIGRSGNVGTPYIYEKCWAHNTVLYIDDYKGNDPQFLYYFLKTLPLSSFGGGSAVPTLNRNHIHPMIVKFCKDLPTQQKIANILSSLDDKIEVNRRINEQLEEMAQALFKSWFVDFEPFKEQPFVETELGMIPEGWKVRNLGDLIEIKYGKDHKKLNDGDIPVYGSGGIMRYVDKSLFTGESVLIPRKGTLNNVMYVNRDFWTVDTMFFSKMKMSNIAIFVYLFLSKKDLASMNSGSAVPSMTVDILNKISLVIPNEKTFENFNNIVSTLFFQMSNNAKEITHLTTLRDTLLPKLMSGEIDVNGVEV
jgi:type I restriction enzyme S subunit